MSNAYLGYHFIIESKNSSISLEMKQLGSEILVAQLGEKAFESFMETETGVSAFVQKDLWDENILENIGILKSSEFKISYNFEEIEQVNWNEEWEKNFEPIDVDGNCHVRAPFHEKTDAEFDIVIEPKMSFGTGHHETTHMMIQHLLDMDVTNLKTLDMGCGTAILAILAEMKGAKPIDAIDIDNWCYLNSIENAERNNCKHITVYEGVAELLVGKKYDLVIANINRNILLDDMQTYSNCLDSGGILLLSGFYKEDISAITAECKKQNLTFVSQKDRNNWVALQFIKN
jgi:ribosomal protein L11 methyltransferase